MEAMDGWDCAGTGETSGRRGLTETWLPKTSQRRGQVFKGHVCSFLSLWLGAGSAGGPCASSPVAGAGLLCSGRRQVPSAHPRITIVAIPTHDTDPPDCVQSAQLAAMLPTRYGRCIARRLLDVVPLPSPLLWPGPRAKARQVPLNEC